MQTKINNTKRNRTEQNITTIITTSQETITATKRKQHKR